MSERLLVFDIDGTVAPHDAGPHPSLLPTLQACAERSFDLIVATARRRSSGHIRLGELADYLSDGVFNNGACSWEDGDIVSYQCIERSLLKSCYQDMVAFEQRPNASIAVADERIVFSQELTDEEMAQWGVDAAHLCSMETALNNDPIRLCCWNEEHDLTALYEHLHRTYPEEQMHWRLIDGGHCIFGTAPGLDKASAVRAWCQRKNISVENVIAFGDDVSDTNTLKWAGIGVAVANAHPEVLAASDHVCPPCIEGGVATWIQQHLLDN